jgi:hypothetical protein
MISADLGYGVHTDLKRIPEDFYIFKMWIPYNRTHQDEKFDVLRRRLMSDEYGSVALQYVNIWTDYSMFDSTVKFPFLVGFKDEIDGFKLTMAYSEVTPVYVIQYNSTMSFTVVMKDRV